MAIVKVKEKYQVTLPPSVRQKARLSIGDLVNVDVQGGKITLTPQVMVDRDFIEERLKEGLEDIKSGRISKHYSSAKDLVQALRKGLNQTKAKKITRR